MKYFSIIVATDVNLGIGISNKLPWHFSEDLKHFVSTTKRGTVIMGRKTWDSIPEKYRPFKERLNIVVSRNELKLPQDVLLAHSLDEALQLAEEFGSKRKAFVIGGASLYKEAIKHKYCEGLIVTQIPEVYECDTYFPNPISENFYPIKKLKKKDGKTVLVFVNYKYNLSLGIIKAIKKIIGKMLLAEKKANKIGEDFRENLKKTNTPNSFEEHRIQELQFNRYSNKIRSARLPTMGLFLLLLHHLHLLLKLNGKAKLIYEKILPTTGSFDRFTGTGKSMKVNSLYDSVKFFKDCFSHPELDSGPKKSVKTGYYSAEFFSNIIYSPTEEEITFQVADGQISIKQIQNTLKTIEKEIKNF